MTVTSLALPFLPASLVRATQPSDEQLAEPRLAASGASERIGGTGKKLPVDFFW